MGKRKQVRVGPPPTTVEGFGDALLAATPGDADRLAPGFTLPAELAEAADRTGRQLIGRACRGGWLPEDLHQAARRRLDEFAGSYLLDTLAAYAGQFTAVHPDWQEQLEAAGAVRWWTETEPHLPQWAAKHILTPSEAVAAVIEAFGLLKTLPPVTVVLPAPGTPLERPVRHHVDEKKLSRVRALLAKAESSSFPEEAEALSAKAQELMTRHALDRVLVEAGEAAPDRPAARRIWLDTPYTDAKSLLVHVVATANRCRAVFDPRWEFVTVIGDEDDLDSVALLTTSLLVQATRAMITDPAGRSRDFRKSFLVSYAARIGERLEKAAEATIAQEPELLPVLASHEKQVAATFTELFPEVVSKSVTVRSHEGWGAGREAADRARLGE
ncbi:DUF2786 domain-containing protein [Amycolatopsis balhimycina DSM 5908]|uniref:DUF2786 domain-containing protein n=1 Tax=Amycolatopsis balhimycina DSM 5908 TaxID=1081091 RepID=A0A428WLQ2_AMYBA|nr:DUF2786 domain-containing protein [Amycolatopsis balhimycina]RSM43962.1 DUF2786 domain-containing protein [Amycolatopsis balhimycina DSM 5908]